MLSVVNNIINSDLSDTDFRHVAFYNADRSRIEMHLVATADTVVNSPYLPEPIVIRKDESIHTENSYKFTPEMIRDLVPGTGLSPGMTYSDQGNWFSIASFRKI
jgi:L-histidine N-alpha-methyltransferase